MALQNLERLFVALSDATRLKIINLLGEGEVCVGHLVDTLGESQPKISRHLAFLKDAGLVDVRRDGKWIYYNLVEMEPLPTEIMNSFLDWCATQSDLTGDREFLAGLLANEPETRSGRARQIGPAAARRRSLPNMPPLPETDTDDFYEPEEIVDEPRFQPTNRSQEIDTFLL